MATRKYDQTAARRRRRRDPAPDPGRRRRRGCGRRRPSRSASTRWPGSQASPGRRSTSCSARAPACSTRSPTTCGSAPASPSLTAAVAAPDAREHLRGGICGRVPDARRRPRHLPGAASPWPGSTPTPSAARSTRSENAARRHGLPRPAAGRGGRAARRRHASSRPPTCSGCCAASRPSTCCTPAAACRSTTAAATARHHRRASAVPLTPLTALRPGSVHTSSHARRGSRTGTTHRPPGRRPRHRGRAGHVGRRGRRSEPGCARCSARPPARSRRSRRTAARCGSSPPTGPGRRRSSVSIPVGRGIAGWVAMSGEAIRIADVASDSRFARDVAEATALRADHDPRRARRRRRRRDPRRDRGARPAGPAARTPATTWPCWGSSQRSSAAVVRLVRRCTTLSAPACSAPRRPRGDRRVRRCRVAASPTRTRRGARRAGATRSALLAAGRAARPRELAPDDPAATWPPSPGAAGER